MKGLVWGAEGCCFSSIAFGNCSHRWLLSNLRVPLYGEGMDVIFSWLKEQFRLELAVQQLAHLVGAGSMLNSHFLRFSHSSFISTAGSRKSFLAGHLDRREHPLSESMSSTSPTSQEGSALVQVESHGCHQRVSGRCRQVFRSISWGSKDQTATCKKLQTERHPKQI